MLNILIKCDICGHEFDHTEATTCDCGYDPVSANLKCPNCMIDLILPPELEAERNKEIEENSLYSKLEKELNEK